MYKNVPYTSKIPKKTKIKIKEKKEMNSNWFITVNTHIHRDSLNKEQRNQIKKDLENRIALALEENYKDYIKVLDEDGSLDDAKITNKIKVEFQKSNKSGDLHSHNLISIKHGTRVQLDYNKIKILLKDAVKNLGDEYIEDFDMRPNIHMKFGSDNGDAETEYMEKGTHKIWSKVDVKKYYEDLRERGITDPSQFNRFSSTK